MAYPLLGTKIVIDEEKVLREKKYRLDAIYEYNAIKTMGTVWRIRVCLFADMLLKMSG